MEDGERRMEREAILQYVVGILREITADWDVGEITAETCLGNLGLESISLVYLIAEIQQHYDLRDLLFKRLRAVEMNITLLRVADIVDLVSELASPSKVGAQERSL
jgi:acyl carrier protein